LKSGDSNQSDRKYSVQMRMEKPCSVPNSSEISIEMGRVTI